MGSTPSTPTSSNWIVQLRTLLSIWLTGVVCVLSEALISEVIPLKVDIEDVSSCRKTLKIEIPPEDVNAEFEKAYEEVRTTALIPGFRKGRAPRNVIKMRFGEYIKSEVIDKLLPPAFEKAATDANLEILRPLDVTDINPPFDEISVKENEPLAFEITVDVKPEIEIPDLAQLEVEKGDVNVRKEDVDNYLNELREEQADFIPVEDRPVQEGDYVTLSILATSDGEVLEEQEELVSEVGENMPIPEIAQHLIGMKPGDEKEFSISLPEDHKMGHLAGKEVDFSVTLHKITEKHLPALDDDFAKDLGEDDLQHLTAAIWNELVEMKRQSHGSKQREDLVNQLLEKSQFEIPDFLVEEQVNARMRISRQITGREDSEISEEELSEYRSSALEFIKTKWILDEIARREEIEVTDEELEAEVRRMAQERDREPQKYMKWLEDANRIDGIRASIRESKIFGLLVERASAKRTLIV